MGPDRRICRCRCKVWPRLPPRMLRSRVPAVSGAMRQPVSLRSTLATSEWEVNTMLGHSCRTILSGAGGFLLHEALPQLPLQHLAGAVFRQAVDDAPVLRPLESGYPIEAELFKATEIKGAAGDS